jgi:UDP-N-acetylmuramate: L-alanyl-gamma-D-glutamyl-meso-diaminopimelate ligase
MHFHFLGICGTLMGSVAAALKERGHVVTGSDDGIYPPMSTFLASRGITIASPFSPANLPATADRIIIGNAMSRGNPEVEEVLNRKLPYISLPEALRTHFLGGKRNLVVTGTHGKTTTSSLLAWMLESAGKNPTYLIGGLPANLGQGARFTDSEFCVLEGDEYDTAFFDKRSKFVHYLPECVIINNIEFDHADIFHDIDEIILSFTRLVNIVPKNGLIAVNSDDANVARAIARSPAPLLPVGMKAAGEGRICDIVYSEQDTAFTIFGERFTMALGGEFNVRNAAMAIAAARFAGLGFEPIRAALASFQGVKRRQELYGEANGISIMDDFGHHPTAIAETLASLRRRQPTRRIWAIFEPRSNTTRRNIFQHALPAAFAGADGVIMARVARLDQLPEAERLNPEQVIADIAATGKPAFYEADSGAIVRRAASLVQRGDLVVVFSNGGFDDVHAKLLDAFKAKE